MKIGVCSANSGPYTSRETLFVLADLAESFGIESIWVSEHLVLTDPRRPPSPMEPDDPILDPVATLAFLAARTDSVRLGTAIVVLPLRNPLILAKELASVDVLSNRPARDGRLRTGGHAPDDPRGRRVVRMGSRPRGDRATHGGAAGNGEDTPRGEGLGELEITITPPSDVDLVAAKRYEELGVHRLNLMLPWSLGGTELTSFFTAIVRPLVRQHPSNED